MPNSGNTGGSLLLLEELFAAGDARFLTELRNVRSAKTLAPFLDRWKRDKRPWARDQIIAYLELPLNVPGHQTVVKRLFKQAEADGDHELVGTFAVVFDRLIRRVRKIHHRYDWQTRQSWQEETLRTVRNELPTESTIEVRNPSTRQIMQVTLPTKQSERLFSYHTRYYLRRRAWRYFRMLGFQRPQEYVAAVTKLLARYTDDDLSRGEHVLDCWTLLQACYRKHPALKFGPTTISVASGRSLAELSPAPRFAKLWQTPAAFEQLIALACSAQARLVRQWAMALLREHASRHLVQLGVETLLPLLDHQEAELQELGAELLEQSPNLATLSLDAWLKLLEVKNPMAIATIAVLMRKHIACERLTLAQRVDLACAKAAPVAKLGLQYLQESAFVSATDCAELVHLSNAKSSAEGAAIARWALGILASREHYHVETVMRFFDALLAEIRQGAWAALTPENPAYFDPVLFARMTETPYEDMRLQLIEELARRAKLPGGERKLLPVWSAVLLGVHRGGRQKLKALEQLSQAIIDEPEQASDLLPVISVALRSIRPAERRGGLAAVARLVEARPELRPLVKRLLPELVLTAEAV